MFMISLWDVCKAGGLYFKCVLQTKILISADLPGGGAATHAHITFTNINCIKKVAREN